MMAQNCHVSRAMSLRLHLFDLILETTNLGNDILLSPRTCTHAHTQEYYAAALLTCWRQEHLNLQVFLWFSVESMLTIYVF